MNEYNAQNPSEMLHLLLDGELEAGMETPLFSALLENDELRNEMRELISIRESVRSDYEAYAPPFETTKSIFSSLGYSTPIAAAATSGTASQGFWYALGHKIWHPVTTAVLASLVTALLFLNFNNSENDGNTKFARLKNNITKEFPVVQQSIETTETDNANTVIKSRSNNTFIPRNSEFSSNENISTPEADEMITKFDEFNKTAEPEKEDTHPTAALDISSQISFRPLDNVKLINNFAIGAFVPITENFQLGLEAGKEPFAMVFWDIDNIDNQLYKIEQNPTLLWAGLGLKYVWNQHIELLANAQPFIHLTLASTSVGPLARSTGGIQFISESGLGIMLGIEANSLLYSNENTLYTSNKFGVTYGMFVRF